MDDKQNIKNENYFLCELCDFVCNKQSNMHKHEQTQKHIANLKRKTNHNYGNKMFTCDCGKKYKFNSGLSRHKMVCKQPAEKKDDPTDKELIMMLIKENAEMKTMMLDVCKKIQPTISNVSNVSNSHNKFNLQFFLNTTCKDALNLTDFVESMKIQFTDLENVGSIGYVNGLSNIIINNLKALDINKRPVHCSDVKREIMYVKEENKWEKEKDEKENLKKAIKKIAYKNVIEIPKWQKEHPGCEYSNNRKNDDYLKIVNESMGAYTEQENEEYINKIIKNVAKEVTIEKIGN